VDDFLAGALEYARLWSILRPTYGEKWKTAWERFYVTPREIAAKPFAIDPSHKNLNIGIGAAPRPRHSSLAARPIINFILTKQKGASRSPVRFPELPKEVCAEKNRVFPTTSVPAAVPSVFQI
jgi:hypothetical protein